MSGEVILYQTEDGRAQISLRAIDGTVWLSQADLAELFDTSKQNISLHLKNIFAEGELVEAAVVKEYLTTAADGKAYRTLHYTFVAFDDARRAVELHDADAEDLAVNEALAKRAPKGKA